MMKNPRNPGKKLLAFMALATLVAFSLAGCKNFMKSDDDVKEQMQQEVDVANAPEVSVRVQSSSDSLGSVTPNGPVTFKVNVPSSVLASELAGGFIKWAAFYSGDMGTEVTDAVTFTDAKAKETPVTLLVNRPDVVIQAMFEKRPQVTYYFPDPLNGDAYTNSPIRITFSKPIDPASLTSTVEGKAVNNITFTQYFNGITKDITATNYGAGSLSTDGKVIVFKSIAEMGARSTMTVRVAKAVRDTSGLEMADDYSFNFKVGTSKDADPPEIGDITAGLTESYEFPAAEAARRITASQGPIYVRLRGTDVGAGIVSATITPTLTKYDDAGNILGTVAYAVQTIPWIADAGTMTSFSLADLTAGDAGDGLLTLSVVLEDGNENKMNPPAVYKFVRDTTAPSIDPVTQLARITTSDVSGVSGGSGFYNKASTIYFSNGVSVIDAGFAGDVNVPRLRSETIQYRVSFNFADFSTAPESNWVAAGSGTSIALSSYTGPDGSAVPIYVQLRDDLKNTSIVTALKTIPVDNNPPMGGSVSITNALTRNGLKFVNGTSLDYTVKATDGISGVARYCVKLTNDAPVESDWINCSSGADGTLTVTGSVTVDSSEGKKTLYAWFQDGAKNATLTAVSDTVFRDKTVPSVSDFYLREKRNPAFNASTDKEAATQYSNDKSFFFMFIADDNASGFSKFTYTDDKGTSSGEISMQSAASAGSGDYTVTNLNVATLDSTDGIAKKVLVTGILTIPANNSEHTITVKVKDGADNESSGLANNAAGTNRIIFDGMAPSITSFDYDTSATSGYYLTPDKMSLYTNLPHPKVIITAADAANSPYAVSGLKDAVLSYTVGDWTTPSSVSFSPSLKETANPDTVTAELTVGSDATATFSAKPRDYAGNEGTARSITLIKDQTSPTLALYLYAPTETVFGAANAKVVKDVGKPETIDCSAATHNFTSFYVGMIGYDSGSGINAARVHSYDVIKRTKAGESVVSSGNKLIISANETITPDSSLFGTNKSAVWFVRVKAMDNVGNEMKNYESVGYTYDVTPPSIDNNSLIISFTENGDMKAKKISMPAAAPMYSAGEYYFIPGSELPSDKKVYLRIKATDKPSTDESGSGINTVNGKFTIWDKGASSTRDSSAEITTGEPSAFYVPIAQDSTKSVSLTNVAVIMSTPTVTDKCGNNQTGTAFVVAVDDGLPTATPTFSAEGTGTVTGVKYITDTATLSFTPTDPETGGSTFFTRASGMFGYALTTSSMKPDVPDSGLGFWTSYSSGPVTISAADLQTTIGSGTKHLYLHLLDNAGNRNTIDIGNVQIDKTPPTLSGIRIADTVNAKSYAVGGVTYVASPTFNLYATAGDEADGSGIASFKAEMMYKGHNKTKWSSGMDKTGTLGSNGEFTVTASGAYDLTSYDAMKFKITVWDKAGNHTESIAALTKDEDTGQFEVRYDGEAPTASATFNNYTDDDAGTMTFISSGTTVSLSLTDSDKAGQTASGIKGWRIQKASDPAPTKDSSWVLYTDTSAGLTAANTAAAGKLLDLVKVNPTMADLYTIDNVDHVSVVHHLNGGKKFMVDLVSPTITITTVVSSTPGVGGYYVDATPKVSFTAVDPESALGASDASGVNKYLFSTNATETATTINGTTVKPGQDCAAVNTDILVTGFNTTDYNTVYLHVTDKAGNVTTKQLVDHPTKMDKAAPLITHAQAWSEHLNIYKTVDDDKSMTVKIEYPANAETASGVKYIKIAGDLADPGSIAVVQDGTTPLGSSYTYDDSATTKVLLISLNTPVTLTSSGSFYVRYMKVAPDSAKYTVTLLDAVGNAASGTQYTVTCDGTPPESLSLTLSDGDITSNTSYSSLVARATGSYTEAKSQLYSLTFSGDVSGFDSSLAVTCGGNKYTEGGTTYNLIVSGTSLVLDPPPPSSNDPIAYEVTGILLKQGTSDGDRSVSLQFTNTAELSDSAIKSIKLDTTPPTLYVQLQGTESPTQHYPTTEIGSATEDTNATCWLKYGSSPASANIYYHSTDTGGSGVAGALLNTTMITSGNLLTAVSTGDTIQAVDGVGNKSYVITMKVLDDSIAPTFTLTPHAEGVTTSTLSVTTDDNTTGNKVYTQGDTLVFDFTAIDNVGGSGLAKRTLTIGSTPTDSTTFPATLSLGAIDTGTVYALTVTDNVSNVSKTLGFTVYKDIKGPILTVTPKTPSVGTTIYPMDKGHSEYFTTGTTMDFVVSASDDAGLGTCTVSGSGATMSGNTVNIPANGKDYTITVPDKLGNLSTCTLKVTQDNANPVITVTSPATGVIPASTGFSSGTKIYYTSYTPAQDTVFILTASDTTLKSYKVDSTELLATGTTISGTGVPVNLGVGSHKITVYDNLDQSSDCTVTIKNDTTTPNTFTVAPPGTGVLPITNLSSTDSGTYYSGGDSITFTVNAADSDSEIASCYAKSGGTNVSGSVVDSTHWTLPLAKDKTWTVHAVNNAGLECSATVTVAKDNSGPSLTVTSPLNATVYPSNTGTMTAKTYFTSGSNIAFTAKSLDDHGLIKTIQAVNKANSAEIVTGTLVSGNDYSMTLGQGKVWVVKATDSFDNPTSFEITVTQDTTPIAIAAHLWYSSSKIWLNYTSGDASGIGTPTITGGGTASIDTNSNQISFTGISADGYYTVTIPDNVDNISEKKVYLVSSNIVISANMPVSWSVSGSGPYVIGNFAPDGMTILSYLLENLTVPAKSTDTDGNLPSTINNIDSGTSYRITLYNKAKANRGDSDVKSMSITFTLGSDGSVVSSSSVLGSTAISERLSTETVVSTIRKQYFDNARSSSKTNLPVWYTEMRAETAASGSAGQERPAQAPVTTAQNASGKAALGVAFGSSASLAQTKSVEALHAAALSGMKASNGVATRASEDIAKMVKANGTGTFADEVVMTAPEGSPAFVAYARGLAALASLQDGSVAITVDRSSFMVSEGTKPEGLWERLLAFFGVREKGGNGDALVGFAAQ